MGTDKKTKQELIKEIEVLQESEEKWCSLIKNAPNSILIVDREGTIQFLNRTYSGVDIKTVLGRKYRDFLKPEYYDAMDSLLEQVFQAGKSGTCVVSGNIPSANSWFEVNAGPVKRGEEIVAATLIVTDITERRKGEEALRRTERQASAAIEAARGFTFSYDIATGKISWGGTIEEITGYTPEEFAQVDVNGWAEMIHPDDRDRVLSILQEAIQELDRAIAEYRFRTKQGRYVTLSSISLTEKKDGKAVRLVGILQDITERKKAVERLQESEKEYRTLFKNMMNGFAYCKIILDENNKPVDFIYLEINDAFERISGLKRKNIIGKKITEAIPGTETAHPELFDIYGNVALTGEEAKFDISFEPLRIWLSISVYSPGKGYFVAIFEDITQRKKAEERLIRLSNAMEMSTDSILISDLNAEILDVNEATLKMYGAKDKGELIGKSSFDFIISEDREKALAGMKEVMEKGHVRGREYEIMLKNGRRVPVEMSAAVMRDVNGKPIGFVGITRDITERKKAEEALKKSEEKWRSLVENAPNVIMIIDREHKLQFINRTVAGISAEEVIGREHYDYIEPEHHDAVRKTIERVFQTGETGSYQIKGVGPNGQEAWYETHAGPIKSDGQVVAVTLISADITARKKAEEEIKNLAKFPSENPNPVLRVTKEGKVLYSNDAGLEVLAKWKTGVGELVPERWRRLIEEAFKCEKGGSQEEEEEEEEEEVRDRFLSFVITPVMDAGYANFYARDITERKKAEKELLAYQDRLRAMVSEISMVEEKERLCLAGDLHDSIAQILAISKLKLGMLQEEPALTGFVSTMGEIKGLLDQAIGSTRTLMFELSPPALHNLSLEEAVEQLAEQFEEQYSISVDFKDDRQEKPLDEGVRIFLFKTVRELLVNVVKHAQAHNVKLFIRKVKGNINIVIKDDGVGFDHSWNRTSGFGLFNIRERVKYFGGSLKVKSVPGQGTQVTLSMPSRLKKEKFSRKGH